MTNEDRIEAIEQIIIELLGAICEHPDSALWPLVRQRLEAVIEFEKSDKNDGNIAVAEAINSILSMAEDKGRKTVA